MPSTARSLARQPSHYRKYTVVGILLIAIFGGIGGGVSRDVLLNDIPSALTNPLYLILCALAGFLALRISGRLDEARTTRLFDFMSAFSLPWYAAVGCNKALEAQLPYLACILIGVIGPTAGRFLIDITSGRHPAALRARRMVRRHGGPDERGLPHCGRRIRPDRSGRQRSSHSPSASRSGSSRGACSGRSHCRGTRRERLS